MTKGLPIAPAGGKLGVLLVGLGAVSTTTIAGIMRRLLRDIAEGKALGDTTTLADPNVVARLKGEYEALES